MKLRIISAILAVLMLAASLVACARDDDEEALETTVATEAPETEPRTWDDLAAVDMGGKTFTILTRDSESTTLWKPLEWDSEGFSDEIIPDAVFRRNAMVEEKYNCTIQQVKDDEYIAAATADFMTQGSDYDVVVMPVIQQLSSMAVNGYLYDLAEISTISLDDTWWDSHTNDSTSLLGHYYTLSGDIDIIDNMATWCILFNKDMSAELQLDNHYDVVDNGGWTLEKMYENAKIANTSLENVFGIACQVESAIAYLAAADQWTFLKDDTDTPTNQMRLNASFTDAIEKIYGYMKDRSNNREIMATNVIGDNSTDVGVPWGTLYDIFAKNQALYCMGTISNVMSYQIGNMKAAYGILPVPKYTTEMTEYISTYQAGNATGVSILAHHQSSEDVGTFLTAMSAASTSTLVPAFYETTLEGREVPDPESLVTLKIILATREVDIGYVISPAVRSVMNEVFRRSDVSSGYQGTMNSYVDKIAGEIDKTVNAIKSGFVATQE